MATPSSFPISKVIVHPSKTKFINSEQICLNFCDIDTIDRIPTKLKKIKKLLISHNKLKSLKGIECFTELENLSCAYNHLSELSEFERIPCKEKLKAIRIQGNPIQRLPNLHFELLSIFPNLELIDDLKISSKFLDKVNRLGSNLRLFIISFIFLLEKTFECDYEHFFSFFELDHINEFLSKKLKRDLKLGSKREAFIFFFTHLRGELEIMLSSKLIFRISEFCFEFFGKRDFFWRNQKDSIQDIYIALLKEILLRYSNANNRTFEAYLVEEALKRPNIDVEIFANDSEYAFDAVLDVFYSLGPIQAQMNGITDLEEDFENGNEEDFQFESQDRLLIHFPVFTLNKAYMEVLRDSLKHRIALFLQNTQEFADSINSTTIPRLLNLEKEKLEISPIIQRGRVGQRSVNKNGKSISKSQSKSRDNSNSLSKPHFTFPSLSQMKLNQNERLSGIKSVYSKRSPLKPNLLENEEFEHLNSATKKKLNFEAENAEKLDLARLHARREFYNANCSKLVGILSSIEDEIIKRVKNGFLAKLGLLNESMIKYERLNSLCNSAILTSLKSSLIYISQRVKVLKAFEHKRLLQSKALAFLKLIRASKMSKIIDSKHAIRNYKQKVILGFSSYYLQRLKAYKLLKKWHRNQVQMLKFTFSKWKVCNQAYTSLLKLGNQTIQKGKKFKNSKITKFDEANGNQTNLNSTNKENDFYSNQKYCSGNCIFRNCEACKTIGRLLN